MWYSILKTSRKSMFLLILIDWLQDRLLQWWVWGNKLKQWFWQQCQQLATTIYLIMLFCPSDIISWENSSRQSLEVNVRVIREEYEQEKTDSLPFPVFQLQFCLLELVISKSCSKQCLVGFFLYVVLWE